MSETQLKKFTGFFRHLDGVGTTWIDSVMAFDKDTALCLLHPRCAADWECPEDDIECVAIAVGTFSFEWTADHF
jgi:hypothetical protein